MMASIVGVRYDVSTSAPICKGERELFSSGSSRCTSSVLNGTLVCAPDPDVHSQASGELQVVQSHNRGLVTSPRLST